MVLDDAWALAPAQQLRCGGQVVCLLTTRQDNIVLLAARNPLEAEGERPALHQTLADYASQHAPEAAHSRHRDHYLALVEEDEEDWQRIETLYPQLQHAWQRQMAVESKDGADDCLD